MLIKRPAVIPPSEITSKGLYLNRREFMQASAALGAAAGLATAGIFLPRSARAAAKLADVRKSALSTTGEELTSYKDITTYNNYYEFGTGKDDPSETASKLRTRPWSVAVDGEVGKPKVFTIEEILKLAPLEERVYRMRCVEGWSMVIPWVGYSFSEIIKRVQPTSKAKYVQFILFVDFE